MANGIDSIKVMWSKNVKATHYYLYYKSVSDGQYKSIKTDKTEYQFTNLKANTNYQFYVIAKNPNYLLVLKVILLL